MFEFLGYGVAKTAREPSDPYLLHQLIKHDVILAYVLLCQRVQMLFANYVVIIRRFKICFLSVQLSTTVSDDKCVQNLLLIYFACNCYCTRLMRAVAILCNATSNQN